MAKVPEHRSEDEEREFWSEADSTDYVDWSGARPLVLPGLGPPLRTISLRLPEHLLAQIEFLAKKRGVPSQSLIKRMLVERVEEERRKIGTRA